MSVAGAAAVMVAAAVSTLHVADPFRAVMMLLVVALALQPWRVVPARMSMIDMAVVAIWLYGFAQCAVTANMLPTVAADSIQTTAIMVYLLCRRGYHRWIAGSVAASGAIAAVLVILAFAVFRRSLTDAGFESAYDFRFLFQPSGVHCNFMATAMIAGAGVALMAMRGRRKWWRIAAASVMWMAALLTLSRGALIAMSLMWVGILATVRPRGLKLRVTGALMAATLAAVAWCPREFAVAASMHATQSQRMSTQSRIEGAGVSLAAFKDRIWTGYGLGNYALGVERFTPDDSSSAYSSVAPNIVSEIAVGQGVAGLALYAFLAVAAGACIWRRRHNTDTLVGAVTLMAVFVKEMTHSTLWGSSGSMLLVAVILALMQPEASYSHEKTWRGWAVTGVCAMMTACAIGISCGLIGMRSQGVRALQRGMAAMDEYRGTGDKRLLDTACDAFSKAETELRYDRAPRLMLAEAMWLRTGDKKQLMELTEEFPGNHTLQLLAAKACMAGGDTTGAVDHCVSALMLVPRLVTTEWVDGLLADRRCGTLLEAAVRSVNPPETATEKAGYGYLLYHLGLRADADRLLRDAVGAMPSLSTPWRLIGGMSADSVESAACRRRYYLINFGAYPSGRDLPELPADEVKEADLMWQQERMRLKGRYGM